MSRSHDVEGLVGEFVMRKLSCRCRNDFKNFGGNRKQRRENKQKRQQIKAGNWESF